jgi:trans-aconitate 2-methyltransferase
MSYVDFTGIAHRYEKDSLVQTTASELLVSLLQIGTQEDVLDLGCGTGHLAARIVEITSGRVLGIDQSPGMIAEAQSKYSAKRISFQNTAAEDLSHAREFDVIFCNSALQWFRDPARALTACLRALRPGGRMGIQAPARRDYSPNFLEAVAKVANHPETAATYTRFRSPWFFCENSDAYADIFRNAGFMVPFARIETTRTRYSPEQVLKVFESGAAAGYLNKEYYDGSIPAGYIESFRRILAEAFQAQADSHGQIDLQFHRVYLIAIRPR